MLERAASARFEGFERPLTEDDMIQLGSEVDAFISPFAEPFQIFSRRVIEAASNLKVIGWVGAGFEHIDLDAATARGVYVTYNDIQCAAVADQVMALLLCAAKRVVPSYEAVRNGEWQAKGYKLYREFIASDVHHKTIGIAGLGRIGAGVARRARGFDMRILYYDAVPHTDLERELGVRRVDLETLLRESDFVSCNLPLNVDTSRIFDASAFSMMKPTSIFVNTSRGKCVDTEALYEALKSGRIEMAALDVIDPEPFPADHPLLRLPNFILVPHNAAITRETREQQHIEAVEETLRVLEGYRPRKLINPQVLTVRPLPADPAVGEYERTKQA